MASPRLGYATVPASSTVVNAVSAYVEKAGITFASVHEQGAKTLAHEAAAAAVARLVLVSGIGAGGYSCRCHSP